MLGSIFNSETDKDPDCIKVMGKALVALAIFIFTTRFFAEYLFDIRGYIEDYGLEFKNIEFIMILIMLLIFYFVSKILFVAIFYIISKIPFILRFLGSVKHKEYQSSKDLQLIFSVLVSVVYIWYSSPVFASILVHSDGIQKELLCSIIRYWLLSILCINILLSSSRIKNCSIRLLSRPLCKILVYRPRNWFRRNIETLRLKLMGNNDE